MIYVELYHPYETLNPGMYSFTGNGDNGPRDQIPMRLMLVAHEVFYIKDGKIKFLKNRYQGLNILEDPDKYAWKILSAKFIF